MITAKLIVLTIHNILQWVILGLGLFSVTRMYRAWLGNKIWKPTDQKAGMFYSIALDIQLLIGFLLYFVFSDITKAAFADFGNAITNPGLRFFSIEHVMLMVVAIVLAHIGNSNSKKDLSDFKKFKMSALFFTVSLILIFVGIPWTTRPILPGL